MRKFPLTILSADKTVYDGECSHLSIPTVAGMYGVLARHRNTISAIIPGEMHFTDPEGIVQYYAVSKGMMKIEEGSVLVLVDTCERPEEIDAIRAKRAEDEAKRILREKRSLQEHHIAEMKLARALNRLRIKKRTPR